MDYKEKYEMALEKARELYNDEQTRVGMTPIDLEEIFPELKESEDERIRKSIRIVLTETTMKTLCYTSEWAQLTNHVILLFDDNPNWGAPTDKDVFIIKFSQSIINQ